MTIVPVLYNFWKTEIAFSHPLLFHIFFHYPVVALYNMILHLGAEVLTSKRGLPKHLLGERGGMGRALGIIAWRIAKNAARILWGFHI